MEVYRVVQYAKCVIMCLLSFLIAFSFFLESYALGQDEERCAEVSSYDEFILSLNQIQSTGGTIVLTQDIIVPVDESYVYNNGRCRKEVVIETNGHTIYVEGVLELWPFLTVRGDDSQKELFHVHSGGTLWLISICLDAGENGVAVVQEEGAFLVYGSEENENMGLPAFSCTGQIISPQTITAAAYWRYNCEKLPVIRIPDGTDFSVDMLPDKVLSIVNRDHQEYEEAVAVVWDETTFPIKHERTLVQGKFADGYAQYEDYIPQCLVVWESDIRPFFLNVYLESVTQRYDMVFMYGESPRSGTIHIQSSDDGENWTDIVGTDGYAPIEVEEDSNFSWILSYEQSDSSQKRPTYYRLLQVSSDGTEIYSDVLELKDDFIFTVADIDGGRGGEVGPNEGENLLPDDAPEEDKVDETSPSGVPDSGSNIILDEWKDQKNETTESAGRKDVENPKESLDTNVSSTPDSISSSPEENKTTEQAEETVKTSDKQSESVKADGEILDSANAEKIAGIAIVVCILVGSVAFFVFKRKT